MMTGHRKRAKHYLEPGDRHELTLPCTWSCTIVRAAGYSATDDSPSAVEFFVESQ